MDAARRQSTVHAPKAFTVLLVKVEGGGTRKGVKQIPRDFVDAQKLLIAMTFARGIGTRDDFFVRKKARDHHALFPPDNPSDWLPVPLLQRR